jgi:hypothetical protein
MKINLDNMNLIEGPNKAKLNNNSKYKRYQIKKVAIK